MKHKYQPSALDATKCGYSHCNRGLMAHTDMASCEACPNIGPCDIWADMLLCVSCHAKEVAITNEYQSVEKQAERLEVYQNGVEIKRNETIINSRIVLDNIHTPGDLMVADTVSIKEIKESIASDDSIPTDQKLFVECSTLDYHIKRLKQVIFEKNKETMTLHMNQRDIQTYLNTQTNKLREEEREKLKLVNIEYNPGVSKPKPKSEASKKKAFDKAELVHYANELNVPMSALQMICVKKNYTPAQAYQFMKVQLAD